jgi:hypothetical protein
LAEMCDSGFVWLLRRSRLNIPHQLLDWRPFKTGLGAYPKVEIRI